MNGNRSGREDWRITSLRARGSSISAVFGTIREFRSPRLVQQVGKEGYARSKSRRVVEEDDYAEWSGSPPEDPWDQYGEQHFTAVRRYNGVYLLSRTPFRLVHICPTRTVQIP